MRSWWHATHIFRAFVDFSKTRPLFNRAEVNIPFFASRGKISISLIVVERDGGIEGLPRMNMFSKSAIINHALSGGTMRRVMEGFVAKQRRVYNARSEDSEQCE